MDSRTVRERVWRPQPLLVDTILAVGLTAVIQVEVAAQAGSFGVAAEALLITVPLLWRRSRPLPVFALVVVGIIITFTSDLTANPTLVDAAIAALLIAAYSVGLHTRQRSLAAVVLTGTATLVVVFFGGDGLPPLPSWVVPYVLVLTPFLVGGALRTRQQQADAFRERALRLEWEGHLTAQVARTEERARIARELHDVVAHSVSVMVVQAGAARHVVEREPDRALEALSAVETTGREAMAELRNLLGVLAPQEGAAPIAPQPGMEGLPALVQRVRDAGLPAELRVTGIPRTLPPALDLTVYRIVQEALTNALKYAGQVRIEVAIDFRDDALKVEVLDEGTGRRVVPEASPGRGLAGMRERVALYGGTLEAGPRLGHGYATRAWLPLSGNDP